MHPDPNIVPAMCCIGYNEVYSAETYKLLHVMNSTKRAYAGIKNTLVIPLVYPTEKNGAKGLVAVLTMDGIYV